MTNILIRSASLHSPQDVQPIPHRKAQAQVDDSHHGRQGHVEPEGGEHHRQKGKGRVVEKVEVVMAEAIAYRYRCREQGHVQRTEGHDPAPCHRSFRQHEIVKIPVERHQEHQDQQIRHKIWSPIPVGGAIQQLKETHGHQGPVHPGLYVPNMSQAVRVDLAEGPVARPKGVDRLRYQLKAPPVAGSLSATQPPNFPEPMVI